MKHMLTLCQLPKPTDLFGQFLDVAESATERRLCRNDSTTSALLSLQLHLLILRMAHLRLCLLPLAMVELVCFQRLHVQN